MKRTLPILIVNLIVLIREGLSQTQFNPCPEVIEISSNNQETFGIITIEQPASVESIEVIARISNPQGGQMRIGPQGAGNRVYTIKVFFPESKQWPYIERITRNGYTICTNNYNLQHLYKFSLGFTVISTLSGSMVSIITNNQESRQVGYQSSQHSSFSSSSYSDDGDSGYSNSYRYSPVSSSFTDGNPESGGFRSNPPGFLSDGQNPEFTSGLNSLRLSIQNLQRFNSLPVGPTPSFGSSFGSFRPIYRPVLNMPFPSFHSIEDPFQSIIKVPSFSSSSYEENPKRIYIAPPFSVSEISRPNKASSRESCGISVQSTPLIIEGEDVIKGEYPWMVALFHYRGNSVVYKCGATLISETYVITAAHCTMNENRVQLEFEKSNIYDHSEKHYFSRTSTKIIRNEEYEDSSHGDIALISFIPIFFTQWVKPICLWDNFDTKLWLGTVTGWGQQREGTVSKTPMQTNVSMVALEKCRNSHPTLQTEATDKTFCAGGRSSGPCRGDSGGGFYVIRNNIWYLRGVVSSAIKKAASCNVDEYTVYVDIAYFLDWIRDMLST